MIQVQTRKGKYLSDAKSISSVRPHEAAEPATSLFVFAPFFWWPLRVLGPFLVFLFLQIYYICVKYMSLELIQCPS
jgi:hypothetical protein